MKMPLDSMFVTSCYGMRFHPVYKVDKMHNGDDYRATEGTPIYAVEDGIVVISKCNEGGVTKGAGFYYVIDHGSYQSRYCHLRELMIGVNKKVKAGDLIGYSGTTGAISGAHLHFEIRTGKYNPYTFWDTDLNGEYKNGIDPEEFFKEMEIMENLTWEEVVNMTMDSPEKWTKGLMAFKEMADLIGDFGDLEIAKYFPEYTVKIAKKYYELGMKNK